MRHKKKQKHEGAARSSGLCCMAGITFSRPIFAVLSTPHTTLFIGSPSRLVEYSPTMTRVAPYLAILVAKQYVVVLSSTNRSAPIAFLLRRGRGLRRHAVRLGLLGRRGRRGRRARDRNRVGVSPARLGLEGGAAAGGRRERGRHHLEALEPGIEWLAIGVRIEGLAVRMPREGDPRST